MKNIKGMFYNKKGLLVVVTVMLMSILVGCSSSASFTKSYTLDIETGDRLKVTMDAAKGYFLDKNDEGFYCIKNKKDESLQCTMSFYVPDLYMQYAVQLAAENCSTKTSSEIIKDTKTNLHILTYDNDSIALFWIPDTSVGIYLYSRNDDNMEKLDGVIDMMTIELLDGSNVGSTDPFNQIQQQIQGTFNNEVSSVSNSPEINTWDTNITTNPSNINTWNTDTTPEIPNTAANNIEFNTSNNSNVASYWKVPNNYEETYSCEYFRRYENDSLRLEVTAYYEADEYDLEVLKTGKYSYYDFDAVNIWKNGSLYFVEAERDNLYKYECMTEDGGVYLKISNFSGDYLTHSEVENVVYSFMDL